MRVLLVEDDRMIGDAVSLAFRDAACAVDWVQDGTTAVEATRDSHYDLIVLDLGLPRLDGLSALRAIRKGGDGTPVLIVTARDSVSDKILGLDTGADDYIVKPFEMTELLARSRAVLRRKGGSGAPVLTNGSVSLDPATREACAGDAAPVRLPAREFALLQALLIRPGVILSRAELEERIYGWGQEVESNAVEFLIHCLRRKLGRATIRNVRGVGWLIDRVG